MEHSSHQFACAFACTMVNDAILVLPIALVNPWNGEHLCSNCVDHPFVFLEFSVRPRACVVAQSGRVHRVVIHGNHVFDSLTAKEIKWLR